MPAALPLPPPTAVISPLFLLSHRTGHANPLLYNTQPRAPPTWPSPALHPFHSPLPLSPPPPAQWTSGSAPADPANRVTLDESVSMAFLVMLDTMTPAERVALILHDVFGYPFADVAEITAGPRRPAASWPPQLAAASAPRTLPRPRRPGRPASSGTSRTPGKLGTSAPSSPCWTPPPRRPPTAGAWPAPRPARSRAASRSPATWPTSPAGPPA